MTVNRRGFREAWRKAGCPGSAYGLRRRAAENGATERQLGAIFGWTTGKMATHYTQAADRKRLATDAAKPLIPAQTLKENALTLLSGVGAKAKS
jgi:hypothetical protein